MPTPFVKLYYLALNCSRTIYARNYGKNQSASGAFKEQIKR